MYKKLLLGCSALSLAAAVNAFDIKARVYPDGTETKLRFKAVSKWAKENINKISVGYMRIDRRHLDGKKYKFFYYPDKVPFKVEGDEVVVDAKLTGNYQIHTFTMTAPVEAGKKHPVSCKIRLFTVDSRSFKLRPFKGNVHQHSNHSDGKYSAEAHVGFARIAGFDFTSVTDHGNIRQNPPVMKFAADSRSGLQVYFGEEVHSRGAVLHALAIGGDRRFSRTERPAKLPADIKPVFDELAVKYPGTDPEELRCLAEGVFIARNIRKSGALSVFCHPGWVTADRLNNTMFYTEHMLRAGEFDVVEVVNGPVTSSWNSIVWGMLYNITADTGRKMAVMSSSDSHDVASPDYRRNYNIIFAGDCTFPSFKDAYLDFRAVAVYEVGSAVGKERKLEPLFYGSPRYMVYADFLHQIGFWKRHDAIASRQGKLILEYLRGNKSLGGKIEALAKELDEHRESIYYH